MTGTVRIAKLHHHAFLARDMEETRHFYEDVLGLPLIATWVERKSPGNGAPDNYVHTFFELADGSALAFFQRKNADANEALAVNGFRNISPFFHHLALEVDGPETLSDYHARLTAAGVKAFQVDHGYCHSLYFNDPNGMQLELTTKVAETDVLMAEAGDTAHALLAEWLVNDDVPSNNPHRE